jgi:hypothetical protein
MSAVLVGAGIGSLSVIVAGYLVVIAARGGRIRIGLAGAVTAAIMAAQLVLASRGVLAQWDRTPPPILLVIALSVLFVILVGASPSGARMADRLPFVALIGYQSFRLPLELVMHHAATTGLMPPQMTYTGLNFDILSGALAIPVAAMAAVDRAPGAVVFLWNLLGTILLVNIVVIAAASTPVFAAFGPDRLNTWIAQAPYIWLPGVLVPSAAFGHLLVWRKLLRGSLTARAGS